MWTVEDKLRGSDDEWQMASQPFETRAQAEAYVRLVYANADADEYDLYEWRIVGPSE